MQGQQPGQPKRLEDIKPNSITEDYVIEDGNIINVITKEWRIPLGSKEEVELQYLNQRSKLLSMINKVPEQMEDMEKKSKVKFTNKPTKITV